MKLDATFWRIQLAGWTLYGVVHFLAALPVVAPEDRGTMAVIKLVRAATGCGVSALLPLLYRPLLRGRTTAVVTIAVLASAAASQAWFLADRTLMLVVTGALGLTVEWSWFPRGLELDYGFVLIAWSGAFLVVHYANEAATRRRQALERELALRDAQLAALNHQLSPHFLFNALNSLRSLIAEDADRAREIVTRLSRFLSATLGAGHATTLADELDVVRAYLGIQKVRFEDALDARVEGDAGAERIRVPAMLLQPLVENAIKHGAPGAGGVLAVRVRAETDGGRLRLSVANTGRIAEPAGSGIGLSNVRARLEGFYETPARFTLAQDGDQVRAEIVVEDPERIACAR